MAVSQPEHQLGESGMLDSDDIAQLVDAEGSSSLSIYERRRNIPPDDYVIDTALLSL